MSANTKQIRACSAHLKAAPVRIAAAPLVKFVSQKSITAPVGNSQLSRMPSSDLPKALGDISESETALLSLAPAGASDESWQSYKTASSPWVSESTNNPLLIWELRSKACRWPMWDSWATLPQVEERFYCGASCAGVYCSDHVAIAGHGWGSSKKRSSVTA